MGLAQAWGRSGGQHAPGDRSFAASLGLTVLGAIIPGSGFWFAGRRRLGAVVFVVALAGLVTALLLGLLNPRLYLHSILQPSRLVALIVAFVVVAIAWMAIIMFSHLELRPRRMTTWQRIIGVGVAIILCFAVATPFAVGAR
jgi:predicted membrane-bound spermidine synthase